MVGNPRNSGEVLPERDAAVDLMAFATPTEILRLAGRVLIAQGADQATCQLARRNPRPTLSLVSHDGFGSDFAKYFGVLHGGRGTPYEAAAARRSPVMVEDLSTDAEFGTIEVGEVILRSGSAACLACPLIHQKGKVLGVITAHWRQPGWRPAEPIRLVAEEAARRLAPALAAHDGDPDDPVLEADHLRRALTTRTVIAQAQGMLMAREGIDAQAAFDVLRQASQRTNRKLHDIATQIVAKAPPPKP